MSNGSALTHTRVRAAWIFLAPMLVKQVARKARKEHYPAPFALIETWRRSGGSVQSRPEDRGSPRAAADTGHGRDAG